MSIVQRITYTNSTAGSVRIILEPWAEEFVVKPRQVVEFVVRADVLGCLEMEQTAEHLIVYAYETAVIELFSDGKEMVPFAEE